MQLGWIGGGNQVGEVVTLQLGYFAEESLEREIVPEGPNSDGIAGIASGRSAVGQGGAGRVDHNGSPRRVGLGGETVFDGGRVLGFDEHAVLAEAAALRNEVLNRASHRLPDMRAALPQLAPDLNAYTGA